MFLSYILLLNYALTEVFLCRKIIVNELNATTLFTFVLCSQYYTGFLFTASVVFMVWIIKVHQFNSCIKVSVPVQ